MRRDLFILLGLVLLIRLPFIAQPIQGDDAFYLIFAKNALVDPLHPLQTSFRLGGDVVWGAGHTRPPGVAWILAPLLVLFGGVREIPLHLAYVTFSLLAVFSVYFLARRFTAEPLWAALVFASVPAFVVNGNKLESDIPLLAFLALGAACLVHRRYDWSAIAMAVGAFFGYQSVFFVPVLAHWVWYRDRRSPMAWLPVFIAPLVLVAWQVVEWATVGAAPASALAGYAQSYDLLLLERKLRSAAALMGHFGMMVSPLLVVAGWLVGRRVWTVFGVVGAGIAASSIAGYSMSERALYGLAVGCACVLIVSITILLFQKREADEGFLAAWVVVCLGGALLLFYAGSARYLLPLAPALAILVVQRVPSKAWLAAGIAANLLLGLSLARAEYHYDTQSQAFANELAPEVAGKRIWSNGDWGLRHYLGQLGGESVLRGQELPAGSVLVTSELAQQVPVGFSGSRQQILSREVTTGWVPLRTIGRGSGSGYSSSEFGVLPFGLGAGVIDRLTAEELGLPTPRESYLLMNSEASEQQLLAGFYEVQSDVWRWMGPVGTAVLSVPDDVQSFEIDLYVPDNSPTRTVSVSLGGRPLTGAVISGPGGHVLQIPLGQPPGTSVRAVIRADESFTPPGDARDLSLVINSFGFKTASQ